MCIHKSGNPYFGLIFEGGDREWFFIYPRPIIKKKYVQSVSQI